MKEISKRLKRERRELGLTQQDAAVILSVSRVTYVKWETDPGSMPLGKYERLTSELERLRSIKEAAESQQN